VTIDGRTQPGAKTNTLAVGDNAVLRIELNGNGLSATGLSINANNCTVRGLAINNFYFTGNIDLEGIDRGQFNLPDIPITGVTIAGDFIGTDVSGSVAEGNGAHGNVTSGIFAEIVSGSTIGGTAPSDRNLVSGNGGTGLALGRELTNNTVQGNYIGTSAGGTAALGNGVNGLTLNGENSGSLRNLIGGTTPVAGNLISGNDAFGVDLAGSVVGTVIQGNLIGTDVSGSAGLGNAFDGILDKDVSLGAPGLTGITIGGPAPGAGNVVSGNGHFGIDFAVESGGDVVQGNRIGTNSAGTAALGNGLGGVNLVNITRPETIGGAASGAGNLISANHGRGVSIGDSSASNVVQGNLIGDCHHGYCTARKRLRWYLHQHCQQCDRWYLNWRRQCHRLQWQHCGQLWHWRANR
jgi:hypothetical protein